MLDADLVECAEEELGTLELGGQLDPGLVRDLIDEVKKARGYVSIAEKAFELDDAVKIPGTGDLNALQVVRKLNELVERVRVLEDAIKTHRSQKADDRCIEDDDRLYEALGDGIKCDRRVGDKAAMLQNCARFIENRCQEGAWPTYAQLEATLETVVEKVRSFDQWVWCKCSECRTDGSSHAVNIHVSKLVLVNEIKAGLNPRQVHGADPMLV